MATFEYGIPVEVPDDQTTSNIKNRKVTFDENINQTTVAADIKKPENGATSFFIVLRDPSLCYQRLPCCFQSVADNAKLSPSLLKIRTTSGLSWLIKLEKDGEDWFLKDGWNILVNQLRLGIAYTMVMDYEGLSTFLMTVLPSDKDNHVGPSFYHMILNVSSDRVLLPRGWFAYNFQNKIPSTGIILQASQSHMWNVYIRMFGKNHYLTGFQKPVQEIPLHYGAYIVFKFVSEGYVKMDVFKTSCIQALLPLKENEVCGFLDPADAPIVEDFSTYRETVSSSKDMYQDVFTFTQKVETRPRLPTEVWRSVKAAQKDFLKMNYDGGNSRNYQITRTNSTTERYVLEGWKDFMDENQIFKKERCVFNYFKSQRIMVVRKTK